jgi:PAS domain S-box-containing protein
MRTSIDTLVGAGRRTGARVAAVAVLVVGVGVWIVDGAVDAAISRRASFTDELLHPSAVEIWVRIFLAALLVALYLDRRSAARLRLLTATLDAAPDGIQIASLDGRIAYSNDAVERIYGFTPRELRGKSVNDMNADPSFASRFILPSLQRHGRWVGEIDVKHKDGRTFPIWLTTSVVADARGKPMAAVGIIRDITDRKRTEESLRQHAQRLEQANHLKQLFADILHHDLLGPASSIQMSLQLLERQAPGSATWTRQLAASQRSCRKLTQLIEDATRYVKVSASQDIDMRALDLGEVLKSVLEDFELPLRERGTRVSFAASDVYPARAHPMISEVFTNLLSNAIKYGRPAGEIGIGIEDLGREWKVFVSDTGEGIPDADKPRVFTRFERLRKDGVKGTGLGLAISKYIVDIHGGRIWIEDNPPGGTVFCVTVPKADALRIEEPGTRGPDQEIGGGAGGSQA